MAQTHARQKSPRFRAEIFDKMQLFFQEYNDHQIRAVICFGGMLDRALMEKAVRRSAEFVPLIGCRFVPGRIQPHWEPADGSRNSALFSFIQTDGADCQDEIDRFITGKTEEYTGPQMVARVIRAAGRDTLAVVINHMVCDGAGFKEYLYLLSEIYTRLQEGTAGEFAYHNGSRNAWQIFRRFTVLEKLRAYALPNESTREKNTVLFPLSREKAGQKPRILTHKLSPERLKRLKTYGKLHAVTINDIVLAAYFRALNRILDAESCRALTIPCMVDLRRYLPGRRADGICNLASMITCRIGATEGESFGQTVAKVNAVMNRRKSRYPGLNGLSSLRILYCLPFEKARAILKKHYANPMIGMTNIGVIDSGRLRFGDVPIQDAYIAASIKRPPYFQLALTTYRDCVTFTVSQYCQESDTETIRRFLRFLDEELDF